MRRPDFTNLAALALVMLVTGCGAPSPATVSAPMPAAPPTLAPPPPSNVPGGDHLSLSPVGFDALPGWNADKLANALPALRKSCATIEDQPARQPVGRDGMGGVVGDWLGPCGALRSVADGDSAAARRYFQSWFQPFRASANGQDNGQLTGYYEPEIAAALKPDARHRIPLYARPRDLVTANDPSQPGHVIWGRMVDGRLTPYPTRAEIEAGAISDVATPIAWASDPVDAQILEVQGSGRLRLPNGKTVRIGFDGTNGRAFVALGRALVDAGKIPAGHTDLPTVAAWLKAHPSLAKPYLDRNPRVTFFKMTKGDGPVGSEGVVLTAGRSLAVDPRYTPYGVPLWIDSTTPDGAPLRRLVVTQDSGGAITGPLRGDVFWGNGDAAFELAGRMNSRGRWFVLLPRHRSGEFALAAPLRP